MNFRLPFQLRALHRKKAASASHDEANVERLAMRTIAMICFGLTLGGCITTTEQTSPVVTQESVDGSSVKAASAAAPTPDTATSTREVATKRASDNSKGCDASDIESGAKISEKCRLKLDLQMARAAELKVEGHTTEEIAAIMGVERRMVRELLMPAGLISAPQVGDSACSSSAC